MDEKKEVAVKINSLNLTVGKKTIELTVEEAKKLKTILDELFGKEVVKEVIHEHHYDWYYYPPYVYNKPNYLGTGFEPFVTFNCLAKSNSLDISL